MKEELPSLPPLKVRLKIYAAVLVAVGCTVAKLAGYIDSNTHVVILAGLVPFVSSP